jgi:hypothetical protein
MSNSSNATVNLGGGGTLLAIVFFVAKITGYIDWSYWWVFAPIWIPLLIALVIIGFCLAMAVIGAIIE